MANYTVIGSDQKQYGPVTDEQVRTWIREGRVNLQSQMKAESDAEWRPASAFPEFAPMFGTAPTSPITSLKTRLKLFVCLEAAFVFCTVVLSFFDSQLLPPELRDYKASVEAAPFSLLDWIGGGFCIILLLTALTATIGLLLSWRPARFLFLWTRIAVVAAGPFQGTNVEPGWAALFDDSAILTAGVIIAILYYSRLRELYDKPQSP